MVSLSDSGPISGHWPPSGANGPSRGRQNISRSGQKQLLAQLREHTLACFADDSEADDSDEDVSVGEKASDYEASEVRVLVQAPFIDNKRALERSAPLEDARGLFNPPPGALTCV